MWLTFMLRNKLQDYAGPMLMSGDFNCMLVPQLERSFVSPPGRHNSLALRRLLGRAHLSDVPDWDMERAEKDRAIMDFQATPRTLIFTHCQVVARPVHVSIGGMSLPDIQTSFETSNVQYLVLRLITMEQVSGSGRRIIMCAFESHGAYILFLDAPKWRRLAK